MFGRVFAVRVVRVFGVSAILAGCAEGPSPTPPAFPAQSRSAVAHIAHAHVRYSISILPGIGGSSASADSINDRGWITGWSTLGGSQLPEHQVLWKDGRKVDLGTLGGPNSDIAFPKKGNTDDIPGVAETSTKDPLGEDFCGFGTGYACLGSDWGKGTMHGLPTLGGNNGEAFGNNDRGEIVGVAETSTQVPKCQAPQVLEIEAVSWTPGSSKPTQLPTVSGDRFGGATAINDRGDIVGGSGNTCATLNFGIALHAILWRNDTPISLPTLGGTMNNLPLAINQHGEIAGVDDVADDSTTHAVLWRNRHIRDLGTLPGDFSSVGAGMNDGGQIVGSSCDASYNCRGFLWQNGAMIDINALLPNHSRYYVISAGDINDDGIIVGEVLDTKTGATPAFMAVPRDGDGTVVNRSPKVILPKSVRDRLRLHGLGRLGLPAPLGKTTGKPKATFYRHRP